MATELRRIVQARVGISPGGAQAARRRPLSWWSRLTGHDAARSAATLTVGTVVAQGITAAVSPILTRLFTPADLGEFGLFSAFLMIASVVLALRYDTAIPTAANEDQAARLTQAAAVIIVPTSVVATTLYGLLVVFDVGGYGQLAPWTIAGMLFALAGFGTVSVMRYWHVRQARFRPIAEVTVVQSAVRAGLQVALGLLSLGSAGLIVGEAVGRVMGSFRLARTTVADLRARLSGWRADATVSALNRYRAFPAFGVPSSLLNALALYLPIPILIALYGPAAGGWFLLVQRVVSVPVAIIGSSVADVFHARIAAESRARGPGIPRLMSRYAGTMFAIGLVPAVALIVFAPQAFSVVFGEDWADAGTIAVAMAPWALAQFVAYPVSRTVLVLEAQRAKLLFDGASLAVVLASLLLARHVLDLDAGGAVGLLAMLQAWLYAGLLWLVWRVTTSRHAPPRSDHGLWR